MQKGRPLRTAPRTSSGRRVPVARLERPHLVTDVHRRFHLIADGTLGELTKLGGR